jgi:hypothetical protein
LTFPFLVEGDAGKLSWEAVLDVEVGLPVAHQDEFAPACMLFMRQLPSKPVTYRYTLWNLWPKDAHSRLLVGLFVWTCQHG